MKLRNWTPFLFVKPTSYLSEEPEVLNLDLERWSEEYEWEQDEWNGWLDIASDPLKTVRSGRGDCEDYALVVASWAYQRGYEVTFGWCFEGVVPTHVVVEFNGKIYSSGNIRNGSLYAFIERSKYDWLLPRTFQK